MDHQAKNELTSVTDGLLHLAPRLNPRSETTDTFRDQRAPNRAKEGISIVVFLLYRRDGRCF